MRSRDLGEAGRVLERTFRVPAGAPGALEREGEGQGGGGGGGGEEGPKAITLCLQSILPPIVHGDAHLVSFRWVLECARLYSPRTASVKEQGR